MVELPLADPLDKVLRIRTAKGTSATLKTTIRMDQELSNSAIRTSAKMVSFA
jgi:hypothetical protein